MPAPEQSLDRAPSSSCRTPYHSLKLEHSDAVVKAAGAERNQSLIQNYTGYMPPHMNLKIRDIAPTQPWMERKPSRDTAPNGADMRPDTALESAPGKGSRHHSSPSPSSGGGPKAEASAPPPPPPVMTPLRRRRPEEELAM